MSFVHPRRLFCPQNQSCQTDDDLTADVKTLLGLIKSISASEDIAETACLNNQVLEPLRQAVIDLAKNGRKRRGSNDMDEDPGSPRDTLMETGGLLDIERLRNIRKQCRNLFIPSDHLPRLLSPTPMTRKFNAPPILETPRSENQAHTPIPSYVNSPRIPESPWLDRLERAQPHQSGHLRQRSSGNPEFTVSSRSPIMADDSLTVKALERIKAGSSRRSQSPVASQNIFNWLRKVSSESSKENQPVNKR